MVRPVGGTKILTDDVAYKIMQMYAEIDHTGRRRYSQLGIAEILGIGETTVYRAIKRSGAYRYLVAPKTANQLETEAEESLARMLARTPVTPQALEEAHQDGIAERLNAAIAEARKKEPDALIEELKREAPLD